MHIERALYDVCEVSRGVRYGVPPENAPEWLITALRDTPSVVFDSLALIGVWTWENYTTERHEICGIATRLDGSYLTRFRLMPRIEDWADPDLRAEMLEIFLGRAEGEINAS